MYMFIPNMPRFNDVFVNVGVVSCVFQFKKSH